MTVDPVAAEVDQIADQVRELRERADSSALLIDESVIDGLCLAEADARRVLAKAPRHFGAWFQRVVFADSLPEDWRTAFESLDEQISRVETTLRTIAACLNARAGVGATRQLAAADEALRLYFRLDQLYAAVRAGGDVSKQVAEWNTEFLRFAAGALLKKHAEVVLVPTEVGADQEGVYALLGEDRTLDMNRGWELLAIAEEIQTGDVSVKSGYQRPKGSAES